MSEIDAIREHMSLVDRLRDAATVLACAPLEVDKEAGFALSEDCAEGADHIDGLEDEIVGYAEALASSKQANRKSTKRLKKARAQNKRLEEALEKIAFAGSAPTAHNIATQALKEAEENEPS